jgi:hypothetical protein
VVEETTQPNSSAGNFGPPCRRRGRKRVPRFWPGPGQATLFNITRTGRVESNPPPSPQGSRERRILEQRFELAGPVKGIGSEQGSG